MPRAAKSRPLQAGWRRLCDFAARWIGWVPSVLDHLKPIRVPLLILGGAAAVTIGVPQAAELFLIALWTDPDTGRYLGLLAGAALAALAMWFVARQAYRLNYPRWPALQDPRGAVLRRWLPRLLGAAVPALMSLGYLLALAAVPHGDCHAMGDCLRRGGRALGLLAETAGLIGFFIARRRWLDRCRRPQDPPATPPASPEMGVVRVSALGPVPLRVLVGAMVLNVVATIAVVWWPTLLDGIGPLSILLLAAAFMTLSGGFLCMLADRRGWPILSMLLLVTALWHGLHLNDNHRVRQYPAMSTHEDPAPPPPDTRAHFDDYAQAWLDQRCERARPCPVVLVAAEGGGMRSAAWTALVLARLTALVQARHPTQAGEPVLAQRLFAASGVSGGSLGLAAYVSLLRAPANARADTLETRARSLLDHDFLAPTLANMLFVDFTQRWLPGAWFDDRARALTRAWEHAAREQGVVAFAQPFADLYRDANGRIDTRSPALFFNSTTVAEGRRFIEHPFQPLATPQQRPWSAALDGSAWLDPRLPLSEAVLNSARFTYVSPAGTLQATGAHPPLPATLQLVDGAYYENSGATTLLEVMRRLQAVAARRGQPLRFMLLHISNDPTLRDFISQHDPARLLPRYSPACPQPVPATSPSGPSGELAAPLQALLHTRNARGDYARAQLRDALDTARGDALWHLRLCLGNYPTPLGWTLSSSVFDEMQRQLRQNYPLPQMAQALDVWLTAARAHVAEAENVVP
jgi:hypothetical protein